MSPEIWRLIPLHEGTGAKHMAIDSWLLDQHVKGLQPSCLRFYTWRSPTISLGYHQRQFPAHWNTLHWQSQPIDLVRRPTGGRAVLHQGDLTYALITSGFKGSRRDVYRQLCQFLIEGWRALGVKLAFGEAGRGYIHNPNCFGSVTAADLVMENGYKLIGSAQVYRDGCVLQHGSMRLQPDSKLFEKVFGTQIGRTVLSEPLQAEGSMTRISEVLTQAAIKNFDVCMNEQLLTPVEQSAAFKSHLLKPEQPLSSG